MLRKPSTGADRERHARQQGPQVIEGEKTANTGAAGETSGIDERIGRTAVSHASGRLQRHAKWAADTGGQEHNLKQAPREATTRRHSGERRETSATISLNPIVGCEHRP
jgi:hypothetical protein